MTFKAVLDIALHLESFRNIDLTQQGVYQLRFRIFHKSSDGACVRNIRIYPPNR